MARDWMSALREQVRAEQAVNPPPPALLQPGNGVVPLSQGSSAPGTELPPNYFPPKEDNPFFEAGKDILRAAGWLLDVGNKYVTRPALGWLYTEGEDILDRVGLGMFNEEQEARLRQAQQEGGYTGAFHARFEGHPWAKFLMEATLDPLNLTGIGLVGKLGKARQVARLRDASQAVDKAFQAAVLADEALGAIQALPVTVPLAAARRAARWGPIAKALESAPVRRMRQDVNRFEEALRAQVSRGAARLDDLTDPLGSIARMSVDDIAQELINADNPQEIISGLRSHTLASVWERTETDPTFGRINTAIRKELQNRGLIRSVKDGRVTRFEPSEKLRVHQQLDTALTVRQMTPEAKDAIHNYVDAVALLAFRNNPDKYKTLEDVYAELRFGAGFTHGVGDRVPEGDRILGYFDRNTLRIVFNPAADITTVVHELAHFFRQSMGPEVLEAVKRAAPPGTVGPNGELTREFEEWFADAFENLIRTGTSGNEGFDQILQTLQRLSDVSYFRKVPASRIADELGRIFLRTMAGEVSPVPPSDVRQAAQEALRTPPPALPETVPGPPIQLPARMPRPPARTNPQGPDWDTLRASLPPRQMELPLGYAQPSSQMRMPFIQPLSPPRTTPTSAPTAPAPTPGVPTQASLFSPEDFAPGPREQQLRLPDAPMVTPTPPAPARQARPAGAAPRGAPEPAPEAAPTPPTASAAAEIRRQSVAGAAPSRVTETVATRSGDKPPTPLLDQLGNRQKYKLLHEARNLVLQGEELTPELVMNKLGTNLGKGRENAELGLRRAQEIIDYLSWEGALDAPAIASRELTRARQLAYEWSLRNKRAQLTPQSLQAALERAGTTIDIHTARSIIKQMLDEGTLKPVKPGSRRLMGTPVQSRLKQVLGSNRFHTPDIDRILRQDAARRAVPREVADLLEQGDYVIMTADRAELTPEQNLARAEQLRQDLENLGLEYYEVKGFYDDPNIPENSFLVPGMSRKVAERLGAKYNQESVLIGNLGLVYTSGPHKGHVVPRVGVSINGDETMYFSILNWKGTPVKFSVKLDDTKWPGEDILTQTEGGFKYPREFYDAQEVETWAEERFAQFQEDVPWNLHAVLRHYKGFGYIDINQALTGTRSLDSKVKAYIDDLDKALELAPRLDEPVYVYRGFRSWVPEDEIVELQGSIIRERRFLSTSLLQGVAEDFLFNVPEGRKAIAYIYVPEGTPAIYMDYFAPPGMSPEMELLLPRNSAFRVTYVDVDEFSGIIWINMELIPDAQDVDYLFQTERVVDGIPGDLGEGSVPPQDLGRIRTEPAGRAGTVQTNAPLQSASLRQVLDQIAAEEGFDTAAADRVFQILEPVFELNPGHFAASELWFSVLRPYVKEAMQAKTEQEARRAIRRMMEAANETWMAAGVVLPGLARLARTINLGVRRTTRGPRVKAYGRSETGSVLLDEDARFLAEALQDERVVQYRERFNQAKELLFETIADIAREHPSVQSLVDAIDNGMATLRDVAALREITDNPNHQKVIDEFLKLGEFTRKGKRLKSDSIRDVWIEGQVRAYAASMAKKYGVKTRKPPEGWRAVAELAADAWREQAVTSVRNLAQNSIDVIVKSLAVGVNPLLGRSAFVKAQRWGIQIPDSVVKARGYIDPETQLPEFMSPDAPVAVERVIPGAVGRGYGKLVRLFRQLNMAVEQTGRLSIWAAAMDRALNQFRPNFFGEIRRLMGDAGERVIRELEPRGVDFSVDDVVAAVRSAGGDPELARQIATMWDQAMQEASKRGEEWAAQVHFDYGDVRRIEEALHIRTWAPFHFWGTRNVPFYLQTLAQNPWMLRAWQTYHELSNEEKERLGLPSRFTGTLPVKAADPFLQWFFGPGTTYFNPLVVVSVADQFKYVYTDPEMGDLGRILHAASRVGLNPAPWVSIPLTALGVYGKDAEPPSVLRASQLIRGVTGALGYPINPEAPIAYAVRQVQGSPEPATGFMGSYLEDYLIRRRIAEMSLERTGQPNHPDYVAAMQGPGNPIWEEAARQVRRMNLGTALLSFTSPFPTKYLGETEEVIRRDIATLPPPEERTREFNRELAQSGRPATAYWRISSDPRAAQINAGLAMLNQVAAGPANQYLRQQVINQYPWLAYYLNWLRTVPEGMPRSPEDFLEAVGQMGLSTP